MPSVFLSHSYGDKPFVRDLAGRLRQAGANVWLDEAELGVGESLIEHIASAISETDYIVVILSPRSRSVQSTWVQKELSMAMTKEGKRRRVTVLPVLLERCDVPAFLRDKLYADFTHPEDHEREFEKLIKAVGLAAVPPKEAAGPSASVAVAEDAVYLVRRSLRPASSSTPPTLACCSTRDPVKRSASTSGTRRSRCERTLRVVEQASRADGWLAFARRGRST